MDRVGRPLMKEPVATRRLWRPYVLAAVTAIVGGAVAPSLIVALGMLWMVVTDGSAFSNGNCGPCQMTMFVVVFLVSFIPLAFLVGAVMPRGWQSAVLVAWGPVWMVAWMWPLLDYPNWPDLKAPMWEVGAIAFLLSSTLLSLTGGYWGARWRRARDLTHEAITSRPTTVT